MEKAAQLTQIASARNAPAVSVLQGMRMNNAKRTDIAKTVFSATSGPTDKVNAPNSLEQITCVTPTLIA
jgi:hypothetical protein